MHEKGAPTPIRRAGTRPGELGVSRRLEDGRNDEKEGKGIHREVAPIDSRALCSSSVEAAPQCGNVMPLWASLGRTCAGQLSPLGCVYAVRRSNAVHVCIQADCFLCELPSPPFTFCFPFLFLFGDAD